MEFQKSVIEIIKTRKSSRSFEEREIDITALQKLADYIKEINEAASIKARFIFANNQDLDGGTRKKLGTYGVISGARSCIIGIMDKEERDALEFGYCFEKIILFATDLGLQTCWLGMTFNKNGFKMRADLLANEFIPIVSPVGIAKEKPRIFESAMRAMIKADNRKPWDELFFEGESSVSLSEQSAGSYAVPLEMVRIGPSASNKQPWRIIKNNHAFHFYLCRTEGYGGPTYDMQMNDIGIAKCHFELSAKELGLKGKWIVMENNETSNEWEYITTWSSE